jgi:ribosomal protein S27E
MTDVKCPVCGAVLFDLADAPESLRYDGDRVEVLCDDCGADVEVIMWVDTWYDTNLVVKNAE